MQLLDIPLDQLEIPPVRITMYMPEDVAADFELNVLEKGVLEALDVVHEPGHYWVVNGKHRIEKARARGDLTLPCNVTEGTLDDAIDRNLSTSGLQGRAKVSELRGVIRYLETEKGLDAIAIRRKMAVSQSTVENLLWVNRAVPDVQDAVDAEILPVGHAVQIARIADPVTQARVLAVCLDYRMSAPALREHIKLVGQIQSGQIAAPEELAPPPPPKQTCHYCRVEYDPAILVVVGVCPNCEGKAWNATRPALAVVQGG